MKKPYGGLNDRDLKKVFDYMIAHKIDYSWGWHITDKSVVHTDRDRNKHRIPLSIILESPNCEIVPDKTCSQCGDCQSIIGGMDY